MFHHWYPRTFLKSYSKLQDLRNVNTSPMLVHVAVTYHPSCNQRFRIWFADFDNRGRLHQTSSVAASLQAVAVQKADFIFTFRYWTTAR